MGIKQFKLDGGSTKIKAPFSEFHPSEKIVWRFLRTINAGRTEKEIHSRFPNLSTIGNKLRALRKGGWVRSEKQRKGDQLWYAVYET